MLKFASSLPRLPLPRSMMHNDMTVGAFSHSTAVGKLRKDLPDVPTDACTNFARYNLDEAATSCHYYARYFILYINDCQTCNIFVCSTLGVVVS
ncbi:unnamed protein product [Camellia sinensis]